MYTRRSRSSLFLAVWHKKNQMCVTPHLNIVSTNFQASTGGGFGFGATPAASNPFGAASTPAFGAASTPAFGVTSTATPFGATPGASSSPFGGGGGAFGQTQPSFGAPAATPAFGSPAGGSLFGQQSAPAFGAVQPSAATPFGGGAAPGGFGASGFGQAAVRGTRSVPWQKTQDTEQSAAGVKRTSIVEIKPALCCLFPAQGCTV